MEGRKWNSILSGCLAPPTPFFIIPSPSKFPPPLAAPFVSTEMKGCPDYFVVKHIPPSSIPPLAHTMPCAIVFLPLFGMPFSSHARTVYTSPNFKRGWGLRSMSLPAFPDRWQQPSYFNSISFSHLFRVLFAENTESFISLY